MSWVAVCWEGVAACVPTIRQPFGKHNELGKLIA